MCKGVWRPCTEEEALEAEKKFIEKNVETK